MEDKIAIVAAGFHASVIAKLKALTNSAPLAQPEGRAIDKNLFLGGLRQECRSYLIYIEW
jgi:hypothetical protein